MVSARSGEICIAVEGRDLDKLNNEPGGHRIQRVPPTERKGRVHTSTVTVALIDPTVQLHEVSELDLKVEWYSGTGCGGQNRNKIKSSCRLTHIPTGIVQTAQTRSRTNSYKLAYDQLVAQVKNVVASSCAAKSAAIRKAQVGTGMRGDKIRTYRFQDDVVKDHITNKTSSVKKVMAGNFDLLWN